MFKQMHLFGMINGTAQYVKTVQWKIKNIRQTKKANIII